MGVELSSYLEKQARLFCEFYDFLNSAERGELLNLVAQKSYDNTLITEYVEELRKNHAVLMKI